MDDFGIGAGVLGAYKAVCMAMRQTGRTTRMLESIGEDDRVVFRTQQEGRCAEQRAKDHGKELKWCSCDPRSPEKLLERGSSQGRTYFDHDWLEEYYQIAIERSMQDIRNLQDNLSGFGEPHRKTQEAARMAARFNIDY